MVWVPEQIAGQWVVKLMVDERKAGPEYAIGKDGSPLKFWNEKSAQLKADALNRALPPKRPAQETK